MLLTRLVVLHTHNGIMNASIGVVVDLRPRPAFQWLVTSGSTWLQSKWNSVIANLFNITTASALKVVIQERRVEVGCTVFSSIAVANRVSMLDNVVVDESRILGEMAQQFCRRFGGYLGCFWPS